MAADVFGTYMILAMGLFTVASIIIGYFLLSNSVVSAARGSAYYTYTRISEVLSSSIKSSSSTATNINLSPKYIIFSAYFSSKDHIHYNIIDGIRLFMYGIPRNDLTFFNQVVDSAQSSYSNQNMPSREELLKCVNQPCLCFAELDSEIKLSDEYFKPLACVDICFGENVQGFKDALGTGNPNEKVLAANNALASDSLINPYCANCVNFINSNKHVVKNYGLYSVLSFPFNSNLNNTFNLQDLKDFSDKTKFSFLTDIIECKGFDELIDASGNSDIDFPGGLVFVYSKDDYDGVFTLINANQSFIFELFSMQYTNNKGVSSGITKSYSKTSIIKAEKFQSGGIN